MNLTATLWQKLQVPSEVTWDDSGHVLIFQSMDGFKQFQPLTAAMELCNWHVFRNISASDSLMFVHDSLTQNSTEEEFVQGMKTTE